MTKPITTPLSYEVDERCYALLQFFALSYYRADCRILRKIDDENYEVMVLIPAMMRDPQVTTRHVDWLAKLDDGEKWGAVGQ